MLALPNFRKFSKARRTTLLLKKTGETSLGLPSRNEELRSRELVSCFPLQPLKTPITVFFILLLGKSILWKLLKEKYYMLKLIKKIFKIDCFCIKTEESSGYH